MWRSRAHLLVNVLLGLSLCGGLAAAAWFTAAPAWLRFLSLAAALAVFPLVAHRLAPRLTGWLVDKVCDLAGLER